MERGLAWEQYSPPSSSSSSSSSSLNSTTPYYYDELEKHGFDRVLGCVATVYIRVSVSRTTSVVSLDGYADAVLSRGLLSSLNVFLMQQEDVETIFKVDPDSIADQMGVRIALSKGRNDGLANMMRIVQEQLQNLIKSESESVSSISSSSPLTDADNNARDDKNTQLNESEISDSEKKPTVALLLSGGVDSSVALRLLQRQGYDVTPFYLKIWLEDELAHLGVCPWEDDVDICRRVCEQAGVELQIVSLQNEYHDRVMKHTLNEAAAGRTPNPDILCNSRVKFGCFLEYLQQQQEGQDKRPYKFDYIASGHYAQVKRDENGIARLSRAPDPVKDQSYFLCALNQDQLCRLIFPIGHLQKTEVRELAEEFQLPNRQRPDSQGLCFLGKVKFRDFLSENLGESPGNIVDAFTGDVIGEHRGVWFHTVGQRKGLGPFLVSTASAFGPWYVVAKDPAKKIVYASNKYDEEAFNQPRSEFHIENVHWISGYPPVSTLNPTDGMPTYRFNLKIRHGPKLSSGTLTMIDNDEMNSGTIKLDGKDGGLAPGQYVVFYDDNAECIGGGIISERHWAKFLMMDSTTTKSADQKKSQDMETSRQSRKMKN
mmetsp:Transcript_40116/g.96867  ORF Transcript_40116/g.96867 Transcript_40116/m.96867 type:complete len:599 (+) Transcript_40116:2-1798(+)